MSFLKILDRIGGFITYFRNFVINSIFILCFIIVCVTFFISIIIGINSLGSNKNDKTKDNLSNQIITINIDETIQDRPYISNPTKEFIESINNKKKFNYVYFQDIIDTLNIASKDNNIKAVVINAENMNYVRLDIIKNLEKSFANFKKSGKKIYFFTHSFNQSTYLLASYADNIYMDPFGTIEFDGISLKTLFFKDFLDLIKLDIYTPKAGTHKSATEPYNRNNMSPWVKEEYQVIINDLWSQYGIILSKNKNININDYLLASDKFYKKLNENKGYFTFVAKKDGLISDHISYYNFIRRVASETKTKLEKNKDLNEYQLKSISYKDYLSHFRKPNKAFKNNQIAVIYGIGEISSYSDEETDFASNNILPLIKKATENPKVKALVLYLNTPGGEVIASEAIRRELLHFKNSCKNRKIIVYMSGMTASGGYWISTIADKIVAQESTITGSIGVLAITGSIQNIINNFGIYYDGVAIDDQSDTSPLKKMSDNAKRVIQLNIDNTYLRFLKFVSKSRNMSVNDVDKIAQGKIYTGKQALNIGLIDKIGTFEDAINLAAELTKIDNKYDVKYMTPITNKGLEFFNSLLLKGISEFNKPLTIRLYEEFSKKAPLPKISEDKIIPYSINPIVVNY
ncbi:MAG: signal peptide peptidase SppA [Succinivibrionaceae bacterium]